MSSNSTDVLDVLRDRNGVLELIADTPLTQQQIVERAEVSQPTVSRALTQFKDLGLVQEDNAHYTLTLLGSLVYQQFITCMQKIDQFYTGKEILQELPPNVPFTAAILEESEITVSEPHTPDAALGPVLELTREATRIRVASTMVHAGFAETFRNRLSTGKLDAEVILTDPVADASLSASSQMRTSSDSDQLRLYRTANDLPYSLMLIDTPDQQYVVIGLCTEPGTHGTIVTSNNAARNWAEDWYENILSHAESVEI